MIFITGDKPLFRGYVNSVTERTLQNGSKITNYGISTTEIKNKGKENETKEYSTWFCTLMGNARKLNEERQIKKGDVIAIKSFKQTNVSKKNEDGSFSKAFFNMIISDFEYVDFGNKTNNNTEVKSSNEEVNPF